MTISRKHTEIVINTIGSSIKATQSQIAASWRRSALKHGLDPANMNNQSLLSGTELSYERQKNEKLLNIARPILDNVFRTVSLTGCCVILTDRKGLLLERRTSVSDAKDFEILRLTPGAFWNEETEGTNGIGTSIAENRSVVVFKNQHFKARNIEMSCSGAPVRDHKGKLMGAIDISTCRKDHNEAVVSMMTAIVNDAARKIEANYFCNHFSNARIIQASQDSFGPPALVAVDSDDLVIGATRAARKIFNLTDEMIQNPLPATDIFKDKEIAVEAKSELKDSERSALKRSLARTHGNVAEAARQLGIGRATFYRRMKKLGMI